MEIELKYAINSKEIAQQIWDDEELKAIEEPQTRETVFLIRTTLIYAKTIWLIVFAVTETGWLLRSNGAEKTKARSTQGRRSISR